MEQKLSNDDVAETFIAEAKEIRSLLLLSQKLIPKSVLGTLLGLVDVICEITRDVDGTGRGFKHVQSEVDALAKKLAWVANQTINAVVKASNNQEQQQKETVH